MATIRAYIDGFNLYHAIDAIGNHRLKWINLIQLSRSLIRQDDILDEVHFFTAILNWNHQKQQRHRNYLAALTAIGVKIHEGNFKKANKKCWQMDRFCSMREEKQTDVAIAVKMVADAVESKFEKALLITADSDQIPTVRYVQQTLGKPVLLRFPPNRKSHSRDLGNYTSDRREITVGLINSCRLPRNIYDASGQHVASMPALYGDGL